MPERLFDRILVPGALSAVAQPVFEVDKDPARVHYVEFLIRGPRGTTLETPDILFEYARLKSKTGEVDLACLKAIFGAARFAPEHVRIGVNIHASTLAFDPELVMILADLASASGVAPSRLVVEVVEHAPAWDAEAFRGALDCLKDIGAKVAVDDVGLGHSNYQMILDCRPDYLKIDRYFVAGSHSDYYRQAVLASIAQLAHAFGAQVVAEGIETEEDLKTVRDAGIGLAQGYLVGRPVPWENADAGTAPSQAGLQATWG
jgi:EAL domain-containing protein (putative c-di-GMP-specific phosphodiesterase class I)